LVLPREPQPDPLEAEIGGVVEAQKAIVSGTGTLAVLVDDFLDRHEEWAETGTSAQVREGMNTLQGLADRYRLLGRLQTEWMQN
jgi:hypothetical protein